MEHEDKAQNFLHENLSEFSMQTQNLFENLQNASGFGAGGVGVGGIVGIGEEIAANLGGKFEEEEHDEEWKYIKEVQQSEKQTMKKVGEEIVGIGVGVGQLQEMAEVEETAEKVQSMLLDTEEMQEIHYSPTSIEDSSLATTTTTNNSSSCENCEENLLPQREHETTAAAPQLGIGDFIAAAEEEDKENSDPTGNNPFGDIAVDTHMERPSDLDFGDMHSNLNPEAKEFVPTFSNPTTPTTPTSPKFNGIFVNYAGEGEQPAPTAIETDKIQAVTDYLDVDFNVGEPVHVDDPTSPHPTAVPRHLLSNVVAADDFVAESPRKGRGADMDAISLPAENEFDDGADERPHELAEEIEVEREFQEKITETLAPTSEDRTDYQQPTTPVSLIDHGPETSVDLDLEVDMDSQDVMRKSIYIENEIESDQPIEDLLNTVQPIPTDSDSINNSFAEDFQQQQLHSPTHDEFLNKELLNVEEKEVISHSPSTEELQMQFQTNDFSSSSKDIPAIPIDLENVKDIQESIYLKNFETPLLPDIPITAIAELELLASSTLPPQEHQVQLKESLLLNTSSPIINESSYADNATFTTEAPTASENLLFHDFTHEKVGTQLVTPSTHSTLMEVIKENANDLHELDQQMTELLIQHDGKLPKVVEVEQTSTPIEKEVPIQHSTFNIESEVSVISSEPVIDVFEPKLQPLEELSSVLKEIDIHTNILNDQIPIESADEASAVAYIQEPEVSVADPAVSIAEPAVSIAEPAVSIAEPEVPIAEPEIPIAEPVSGSKADIITVATIATTAVVVGAAAAATGSKKPEPAKKSTTGKVASAATKSKVGATDAKKTTETKKPTTVSATKSSSVTTAARPRTAPVKTATEKKTITATLTTKPPGTSSTTTSTVRKHVTATSVGAAKPAGVGAKTTTATRTTTTVSGAHKTTGATGGAIRNGVSTAAKTTAARPATATTIRKTATTATTSKPRPATAGVAAAPPTKPSTLGINAAANKPSRDLLSPRTTLTSQLRKTAGGPTNGVSNTSPSAKSPMKATTNGIAGKLTLTTNSSTTSAGNRKTITSTTTTKTFTARPAPKTATSTTTTTTTTARRSLAGTSAAVGTNTLGVTNASSPSLRKSLSPSKRSTTSSTASAKLSPNKAAATTANAKNKTKDETKVTKRFATTTTKTTTFVGASGDHATPLTAEMLKEKQQQFNANIMEVMPPQANGSGAGDQIVVEHIGNGENGTHHGDNDNLIERAEIALM